MRVRVNRRVRHEAYIPPMRSSLRHFALGPLLWRSVDSAETTPKLWQSAWQRGVVATASLVDNNRGAYGPLLAVVFAVVGLLVGPGPWFVRVFFAALVGLLVAWLVPTGIAAAVAFWIPRIQRNEARALVQTERVEAQQRLEGVQKALDEQVAAERKAFEDKWQETERLRGLLSDAQTKVAELETLSHMSSLAGSIKGQKSDLELLAEATQRNLKNVLRADLVLVSDELDSAQRTILTAYNDSWYWIDNIKVNVWHTVKSKHLQAPGFHTSRSIVADAYAAIEEAENLRLMDMATRAVEPAPTRVMHEVDRRELREILNRLLAGRDALATYITNLDAPEF